MTDKELLELAAKAIGANIDLNLYEENFGFTIIDSIHFWNPFDNYRQLFRLSMKLRMEIDHNHPADERPWVSAQAQGCAVCIVEEFDEERERDYATRRAIVRAAAAIGEKL